MATYLRRVRNFSFDIKLFLLYNLLANIGFGVIELVFNFYLLELGFREDFIGEWRAIQTISMAITALSLGFWINRFGPWRVITAGFVVFTLASVAIGLVENRYALDLLAIVYGAGLSCLFNPLMPFVMEYGKPDDRQYIAAISFSLISFSLMLGSLIGGFSPSIFGAIFNSISPGSLEAYRAAILTGAVIGALGLIPLLKMNAPRQAWQRHDHREAARSEPVEVRKRVRRDVAVFVAAGGLMSIGVGMVQPFYNVFLKDLGASDNGVGFIFALGGLTAAIVGLGAPAMANRLGSLNAVLLLRVSIIPFYFVLLFAPTLGMAVLAYLVRQASISMAWPIDSTFIGEALPPRARSGVFGLRSSAWNAGFAIASYAAGKIIVNSGYDPTFISLIFFTGASAVLFYVYFMRHPAVVSGSILSALSSRRRAEMARGTSRFDENVAESDGSVRAPSS